MSKRTAQDADGNDFTYEVDDGIPDLMDDVRRPRDSRDVDVDPDSVRGHVLRFYDAMDAVRAELEVEWYNGNMTGPAHDRLEAMVAKMVASPPSEAPSTHE